MFHLKPKKRMHSTVNDRHLMKMCYGCKIIESHFCFFTTSRKETKMTFDDFASITHLHEMSVVDRAVHSLFWLKMEHAKDGVAVRELGDLMSSVGLPAPHLTRL